VCVFCWQIHEQARFCAVGIFKFKKVFESHHEISIDEMVEFSYNLDHGRSTRSITETVFPPPSSDFPEISRKINIQWRAFRHSGVHPRLSDCLGRKNQKMGENRGSFAKQSKGKGKEKK